MLSQQKSQRDVTTKWITSIWKYLNYFNFFPYKGTMLSQQSHNEMSQQNATTKWMTSIWEYVNYFNFPILHTFASQIEQVPLMAGRPFFNSV